jgi:pyruvate formate lyase activating enzyme
VRAPETSRRRSSRPRRSGLNRRPRPRRRAGLKHVYTGNVHDSAGGSTYCAGCGSLLIERDWYVLGRYRLVDGKCPDCGKALAGRFAGPPGTWGARRLRVAP